MPIGRTGRAPTANSIRSRSAAGRIGDAEALPGVELPHDRNRRRCVLGAQGAPSDDARVLVVHLPDRAQRRTRMKPDHHGVDVFPARIHLRLVDVFVRARDMARARNAAHAFQRVGTEVLVAHRLVGAKAPGAEGARFAQLDQGADARIERRDLHPRRDRRLDRQREKARHARKQHEDHGGARARLRQGLRRPRPSGPAMSGSLMARRALKAVPWYGIKPFLMTRRNRNALRPRTLRRG